MNASLKAYLVKYVGLCSLLALPIVVGAWEGSDGFGLPAPFIKNPDLPTWIAACSRFRMDGANLVTELIPKCIIPTYSMNADPDCHGNPAFYVVDGRIYDANWEKLIDFHRLLGNAVPNAPNAPIVHIRPDHPNLVVLFFGHAPEEPNTVEAPRAYFVALNRDKLETGNLNDSLVASWPLDIDEEENRGCGTIHLAGAAENLEYPNTATVFVSTCQHAYGFRLNFDSHGEFDSAERFFEDTPQEINAAPKTKMRAEMVVAPVGEDYLLVWPYYQDDPSSTPVLSGTVLNGMGDVLSHHEKRLYFDQGGCDLLAGAVPGTISLSISGIEVSNDRRTMYVTSPQRSNQVFAFGLLDSGSHWQKDRSGEPVPGVDESLDIGLSPISIGPEGVITMLSATNLVVGVPNVSGAITKFESKQLNWGANNGSPSTRELADLNRGETCGCKINKETYGQPNGEPEEPYDPHAPTDSEVGPENETDSSSGNAAVSDDWCTACVSFEGAYIHECLLEWNHCQFIPGCTSYDWLPSAYPGSDSACQLSECLKGADCGPGFDAYIRLQRCVYCTACGMCASTRSRCYDLNTPDPYCP